MHVPTASSRAHEAVGAVAFEDMLKIGTTGEWFRYLNSMHVQESPVEVCMYKSSTCMCANVICVCVRACVCMCVCVCVF